MIQVQNGRFHYNWLGQGGAEGYPRYEKVLPEFERFLAQFQAFLADRSLGEIKENQWEVTYINHIPKGTVWDSPADWPSVFRPGGLTPEPSSKVQLETLSSACRYEIPPQQGRLHVRLQHGSAQGTEVLILTLTARGPIKNGYGEGLDLGRETIVRAFKDMTSPEVHDYWELTDADG